MKRNFKIITLIVTLIGLLSINCNVYADQPTNYNILAEGNNYYVGDEITIIINNGSGPEARGTIEYDSTVLEYIDVGVHYYENSGDVRKQPIVKNTNGKITFDWIETDEWFNTDRLYVKFKIVKEPANNATTINFRSNDDKGEDIFYGSSKQINVYNKENKTINNNNNDSNSNNAAITYISLGLNVLLLITLLILILKKK